MHFCVNMGFSDQDRILTEKLYIFKGYGAINLLRDSLGTAGTEQTFVKAAKSWQDEAATIH